jgi:PAS domain S-box-containing protein
MYEQVRRGIMRKAQNNYWRDRFERLKTENQALKERLVSSKRENRDLQKELRGRDRLLDSVPAGILLEQEGRIIAANGEFLGDLAYASEEVLGHRLLDFVPPDLKKKVRDLNDKRLSGKRVPSQYELDLLTKVGERRCFEARVRKIRHNGRRAFVTTLTLLEKRKREEREQIEFKKREALMTMVSALTGKLSQGAAVVSRDIRKIKEMVDSEPGALTKTLEHIESASEEALHTIEKLKSLSVSKDDSAGDDLVDLREAVKAAISVVNPVMKEFIERHKQEINLKTYLRSVPPVQGNPDEIRDLMASLILNAVEAMPRGGDLYVTIEENAGYAHIYVQDSGVGIPETIKDRILDPFFTTKGKDRLGLGLSLSYAIVKRYKGEMEFISEKDQGTRFAVRFPTARVDQASKSRVSKKRAKHARILIIEPEEILSRILLQVFLGKGHRVVSAGSAQEGLQILKKKEFDLILVDSDRAEMKRDAVIKKIRKLNRDQPMALITDRATEESSKPEEKSGFELIITKPLDMNRVLSDVEDVLREHVGDR